jgi:hypothetical protein
MRRMNASAPAPMNMVVPFLHALGEVDDDNNEQHHHQDSDNSFDVHDCSYRSMMTAASPGYSNPRRSFSSVA